MLVKSCSSLHGSFFADLVGFRLGLDLDDSGFPEAMAEAEEDSPASLGCATRAVQARRGLQHPQCLVIEDLAGLGARMGLCALPGGPLGGTAIVDRLAFGRHLQRSGHRAVSLSLGAKLVSELQITPESQGCSSASSCSVHQGALSGVSQDGQVNTDSEGGR